MSSVDLIFAPPTMTSVYEPPLRVEDERLGVVS